ncbi:MAG: zinc-binding dehydrogenase [Candidatus Latescibacterota bacterium]
MAEKARAMVLEAFNEPLTARELDIPKLETGQVLVRITAAGICGSDVHMWTGKDPRTPKPMILGHEGVGEVVEVAGEKRSIGGVPLRAEQAILWNRGVVCGKCYWCTRASQPGLCPERWVYGIHRSINQPTYLNGCYSEYIVLETGTDIFTIPSKVDPSVLVPASCSGATMAHGIELCPPKAGDSVVVQGPGPLGVFAVAFARQMGASEIVVIGGTPERLEMCRAMGATMTLNRKLLGVEERRQEILDRTDGRGADLVIDAVGHPEVVREGLTLTRRGGTYLSVGVGTPVGTVELDLYRDIELKNLRLQGVWVSHTRHTQQAMDLILSDPERFGALITHRFGLEEATEALKVVQARKAVKAVLIPK